MYFEQIPKYRDTIMESICKCDAIIDLVRPEDNPNMGAMDLAYKRIFPYDFMVGKTTDVGTYIVLILLHQELSIVHFLILISTFGL